MKSFLHQFNKFFVHQEHLQMHAATVALAAASLGLQAFGMFKSDKAGKRQAAAMAESARGQAKIKRKQANLMNQAADYDLTTAGYNLTYMDIEDEWADYWLKHDLAQLENARKGTASEMSAAIADTREEAERSTAQMKATFASMGSDLGSVSFQAALTDAGIQASKAVAELRYQGWNQQAELIAQKGVLSLRGQYDRGTRALNKLLFERDVENADQNARSQANLVREEANLVERTGIASAQAQANVNKAQTFANFGSLAMQGVQAYQSFSTPKTTTPMAFDTTRGVPVAQPYGPINQP